MSTTGKTREQLQPELDEMQKKAVDGQQVRTFSFVARPVTLFLFCTLLVNVVI